MAITLIQIGCIPDAKDPQEKVTDTLPVVEEKIEEPKVDSAELKRIAEEEALAATETKALEEKLAKERRDSIRKAKKKLAEKKKREEEKKKKEEAAKTASETKPKPSPAVNSPKIAFEKTTHNFGTIKEGDTVKHQFFFKNTGTKDLLIMDATATCGCTAPGFSFLPIKPGDESAINVTFNSKNKAGAQRPEVTVITNAYPKKYVLRLEGVVE